MSDQDILKMMSKTGLEGNKVVDFDEFVKLIHQSENQVKIGFQFPHQLFNFFLSKEEEEEENKEEAEPETEGNDQDESTMEANEDEKDQDTEGGKDLIEIKTTPTDFIQKSPKKSPINPRAARFNQYWKMKSTKIDTVIQLQLKI